MKHFKRLQSTAGRGEWKRVHHNVPLWWYSLFSHNEPPREPDVGRAENITAILRKVQEKVTNNMLWWSGADFESAFKLDAEFSAVFLFTVVNCFGVVGL